MAPFEDQFRSALLTWFDQHARVLPWRTAPSFYKTVVSEFMLQQTQVKTVLPFFQRWLEHFPDFATLAKASQNEVCTLWAGLGYYSRAKNLQLFAQVFLQKPPQCYADLLLFKGIGPYAAAAIASLAFNEPVVVVDGNVIRVLTRIYNIQNAFTSKDRAIKIITPLAQHLLDARQPGKFNEAIMELGALICTKNQVRCHECPLKFLCAAFQANTVDKCPQFVQVKRKKCSKKRLLYIVDQKILLERSRIGGNLSLLELPELDPARQKLLSNLHVIFSGKRSIGTTDFTETIYSGHSPHLDLIQTPAFLNCALYKIDSLSQLALSGPHKRWINSFLKQNLLELR